MMLFSTVALADTKPVEVKIAWKGDYAHNSDKKWSKDNPYDSGFSKNFKNGAPEEFGDVKKDGELNGYVYTPQGATGPVPFFVVMHGCEGYGTPAKEWGAHLSDVLGKEGIGVLMLDSYTSRYVDRSCGLADQHWGRRRADDAYSALAYLIEKKLAKPNEVYVMGYSNGGLASMFAMTRKLDDHPYHFAAGFPIVPNCLSVYTKFGDYSGPMIVFVGDQDDANPPASCHEMMKKKRATPIQLIEYTGANHGFFENVPTKDMLGYKDAKGKEHWWHLSYNPVAEKDMMRTIISAIKTKKFAKGVEIRPTGVTAVKAEAKPATPKLTPAELWKLSQ